MNRRGAEDAESTEEETNRKEKSKIPVFFQFILPLLHSLRPLRLCGSIG
jgi:hypothetical protein